MSLGCGALGGLGTSFIYPIGILSMLFGWPFMIVGCFLLGLIAGQVRHWVFSRIQGFWFTFFIHTISIFLTFLMALFFHEVVRIEIYPVTLIWGTIILLSVMPWICIPALLLPLFIFSVIAVLGMMEKIDDDREERKHPQELNSSTIISNSSQRSSLISISC